MFQTIFIWLAFSVEHLKNLYIFPIHLHLFQHYLNTLEKFILYVPSIHTKKSFSNASIMIYIYLDVPQKVLQFQYFSHFTVLVLKHDYNFSTFIVTMRSIDKLHN